MVAKTMLFWFWCFDVPFTKKTEDGVARIMVFLRFVIYFPMMTNWQKSKKIGISSFIYLPNHWFSSLQIQTAYFIFASKSSESFLHQRFFLLVIRLIDFKFVKKLSKTKCSFKVLIWKSINFLMNKNVHSTDQP